MLREFCSEVGQSIVYLVSQEILNYSHILKPKEYDKLIKKIFVKVYFLCQWFKAVIIAERNSFKIIAIVIILNIIYNNFKLITVNMFETRNLSSNQSIKLLNVAFMSECESKLILLGQSWDISFIHYNKPIRMILIRGEKVFPYAKFNRNLFVFDFIKLEIAMVISYRRPQYIVNK